MSDWKWYIGFAPSIGWDMAFQGPADLLTKGLDERFAIRRPSKLEARKEGENQLLNCIPWMPKFFSAVNKESTGVIARNLFIWVMEASPEAAEDWDKAWEPQSVLAIPQGDSELAIESLAAEVKAKSDLAKKLKNPELTRGR